MNFRSCTSSRMSGRGAHTRRRRIVLGLLAGSSAAALVPSCPSSAGCGRPASPLLPPGGANLARRASHTCLWVAKASAAHRRAPYPVAAEHTPDEDSPTFEGMQARARSFTQTFLLALAVLLTVRQFVVEPFYIPSTSMYPTLKTRDQIAVEKFSKLYGLPKRGDLIVFKPPAALDEARGFASSNSLIKRVVATEGDSVEVREGMLYLNDRAVYEPYVLEKPRYALPRLVVPSGFVFVLGDNRNVSVDSHVWGCLPTANVIGKAFYVLWPIERQGFVDEFMIDLQVTKDAGSFIERLGSDMYGADKEQFTPSFRRR